METVEAARIRRRRSRSVTPTTCKSIAAAEDTDSVKTKKLKKLAENDIIMENDTNHSSESILDPYSPKYCGGREDVTTIPTSDPDEALEEILRGRKAETPRNMSEPYQNHSAGSSFYAHVYNGDVFRKPCGDNSVTLPESMELSALGLDHHSSEVSKSAYPSDCALTGSKNIDGVVDISAVLPPINERKRIPLNAYLKFWSNVDYICSRLPKETPSERFPILAACAKGTMEINQSNGLQPETAQYVKEQKKRAIAEYGHLNGIQSEQLGVVEYLHYSLEQSFEAVASGNMDKLFEIIRTLESGSGFLKILVNLDRKVREKAEEMSGC